jgi:plastocyanin
VSALNGNWHSLSKFAGGILVATNLLVLASPVLADEYRIIQKNRKFSEKKLTIKAGDTITFVNGDKISHNIYSKSKINVFNIGVQRAGKSHSVTFSGLGKVKVRCAIHPRMKLTVIVE